jgi:D-glycero-alpha-D-manno-heptose-7-phosphate kinase
MIITRTPLRVSLLGGGTDQPEYFSKFGGHVLSFSIQKYVYIMLHSLPESDQILLKYSQNEVVNHPSQIQHPVFRAVLEEKNYRSIDISVSSDIPAGTGLGSSSAFTVGLIHALLQLEGRKLEKDLIAEMACDVEIKKLREPIGKQDQYATAIGGVNHLTSLENGKVAQKDLSQNQNLVRILSNNLILLRVGGTRSASKELQIQASNHTRSRSSLLHDMKGVLTDFLSAETMTAHSLGTAVHQSWLLKKKFSTTVSSPIVDELYAKYMSLGAYGGKILGAGGSGYILLVVPDGMAADIAANAHEPCFRPMIDYEGTHLIHRSKV